MSKTIHKITIWILLVATATGISFARTKDGSVAGKGGDQTLRAVSGTYDLQKNRVSRIEFFSTNYGIIGLDVANGVGGGKWPRGSNNQYIFGGGIWFAAKKLNPVGDTVKLCAISYNPNSGLSWMVPGRIDDQDLVNDASREKYRLYFSSDYRRSDGSPVKPADGTSPWPIWDVSTNPNEELRKDRYFGGYVDAVGSRTLDAYPKGPAFISGEDIFATFKDTDLNRYEGGVGIRRSQGYPMRIQYEQMIYSWGFGDYREFLFIKYAMINKSKDTLRECWLAPAFDMDIGIAGSSSNYAANDRTRFYDEEDTLNLAVQWSQGNQGEAGKGFGYIGFDFLESPATYPALIPVDTLPDQNGQDSVVFKLIGTSPDSAGFLRSDKRVYPNREQLGLKTFRNWVLTEDPKTNEERYNFMSLGIKDGDTPAGDKRFLMATGPFSLRPGDTARTVVGIIMANTPTGGDATGATADIAELIKRDKFAQRVYDDNFRTPTPPEPAKVGWRPLNNAVIVQWDSTSEYSYDDLERGLDFMGYRLYRARRTDLDSFDIDTRRSIARGPFGWKQIREWSIPTPFLKSASSPTLDDAALAPTYDSFQVVRQIDSFNYEVRRFMQGSTRKNPLGSEPWDTYFKSLNAGERKTLLSGVLTVNRAATQTPPRWRNNNTLRWPNIVLAPGDTVFLPANVRVAATGITSSFTRTDSVDYAIFYPALMSLLQRNAATLIFPDIESSKDKRDQIRKEVIRPYMSKITNNSMFLDNGDDNNDGRVDENEDMTKTEKLLNNIDYYYWLSAFDEGDYVQGTPKKFTSGIDELNIARTMPLADAARNGEGAKIQIVSADSAKLGGLFNFNFTVKNEDRLNQLFTTNGEGHELEIEFQPEASLLSYPLPSATFQNPPEYGIYGTKMIIRDLTSGKVLFNDASLLESNACALGYLNTFTENGATFVFSDTSIVDSVSGKQDSFGVPDNREKRLRLGSFLTEPSCYNVSAIEEMQNAFDFGFDFAIQQHGGVLRYDTAYAKAPSNANTNIVFPAQDLFPFAGADPVLDTVPGSYPTTTVPIQNVANSIGLLAGKIYNNGPGMFEVTFKPGGKETLNVQVGASLTPKTFEVDYLDIEVRDLYSYNRPKELNSQDSVAVSYSQALSKWIEPNVIRTSMPSAKNVPVGSFGFAAAGFVNGKNTVNSVSTRRDQTTGVVGQGRYYLSAVNGQDRIDFVHTLNVNGNFFGLDFVNKGYAADTRSRLWDTAAVSPSQDFQAGDKVYFGTFGGAKGFPLPGAKVRAKVVPSVPSLEQYTDKMLEDVKIVPNPYYVSHQSQRSPYDAKIFFTRLPKECKITIYTPSGEVVRTLTHNELSNEGNDRYGMQVWDLLTSNRQRVGSSVYIAQVETPNGAKTFIKFAVVVGGFRVIPE